MEGILSRIPREVCVSNPRYMRLYSLIGSTRLEGKTLPFFLMPPEMYLSNTGFATLAKELGWCRNILFMVMDKAYRFKKWDAEL